MPFAYSGVSHLSHKTTDYAPTFVLGMPALFALQAVPVAQAPTPNRAANLPSDDSSTQPPASEQPAAAVTLTKMPPGFGVHHQIKQQIAVWLEPFKQLLAKIYR